MDELIVAVERDSSDGRIYSVVRPRLPSSTHNPSVVIDRQKGRHMCEDAVISRAKALAILLGFRYLEDRRWRCAAERLLSCGCPRCVGAVHPDAPPPPEPKPVHLHPRTRMPVEGD